MFHNADEYAALYPQSDRLLAHYCAPRCGDGHAVETVRQRIAARAGLGQRTDDEQIGMLRGYVDLVSAGLIAGWAQNVEHPEAPVLLDIHSNGRLIGQVLANRYREDLERAGLGSGRHSFEFTPRVEFDLDPASVEVRRSLDGAPLARSHEGGARVAPAQKDSRARG